MKKIIVIFCLTISFFIFDSKNESSAKCVCACVDGQKQNICSSTLDLQVPCFGICPIKTPSIAPIPKLSLPPLGTTTCRQAQVYNSFTKRYEWKTVCR
jgi:hypothetical protein